MKILITGGGGMLGHDLVKCLAPYHDLLVTDIRCPENSPWSRLDITDPEECRSVIQAAAPDCVIHAAAFARVDDCERQADLAMRVNGYGAGHVARACAGTRSLMVYYSTDYVFDGDSSVPYTESSPVAPLNMYGRSKLAGENEVVQALPENHLIIRTSWLFGLNGPNFVDTMIRLAARDGGVRVVSDQVGRPTFTADLAEATRRLLDCRGSGIVHAANSGHTSWYGFARYFLAKTAPDIPVQPISTDEFPLPATRPAFSVLSLSRFESLTGYRMPDWQDAVDRYLALRGTVE